MTDRIDNSGGGVPRELRRFWPTAGGRADGGAGRSERRSRDAAALAGERGIVEGIAQASAAPEPSRSQRARGELVQLDGSPHDWLEDAGRG